MSRLHSGPETLCRPAAVDRRNRLFKPWQTRSCELVERISQKAVERVCAAIFVPTGRRGSVDVDARAKRRVIFAHGIGHQLAGLCGDPTDLIDIALNDDGI